MLFLNKEDFFEIYLNSMLSNYDRDTISLLYQPIIGHNAAALYFSLWSFSKQRSLVEFFDHEQLMLTLGMSATEIQEARSKLEAVGLIQTYYKNQNDRALYIYCLFAPKSPVDFFNDPLFSRLLRDIIGEKRSHQLASFYKNKPLEKEGYFDISAKFPEVFENMISNIDEMEKIDIGQSTYKRKTKDISNGFDSAKFVQLMETDYQIKNTLFNKKNLKEIADLSLLYGVNEDDMASYVAECYTPQNAKNKIDFVGLEEKCLADKKFVTIRKKANGVNGYDFNSAFGKELKNYTEKAPIDYLSFKQNGTTPAPSDVGIVAELQNMGLTGAVINVIVDYTLKNCENVLVKNYVTKIASSMVRENIEDALDALNYLEKINNRNYGKKNSYKKKENEASEEDTKEETNTQEVKKDMTEEEIKNMIDSIEF